MENKVPPTMEYSLVFTHRRVAAFFGVATHFFCADYRQRAKRVLLYNVSQC
jgi:hypothetical protein